MGGQLKSLTPGLVRLFDVPGRSRVTAMATPFKRSKWAFFLLQSHWNSCFLPFMSKFVSLSLFSYTLEGFIELLLVISVR